MYLISRGETRYRDIWSARWSGRAHRATFRTSFSVITLEESLIASWNRGLLVAKLEKFNYRWAYAKSHGSTRRFPYARAMSRVRFLDEDFSLRKLDNYRVRSSVALDICADLGQWFWDLDVYVHAQKHARALMHTERNPVETTIRPKTFEFPLARTKLRGLVASLRFKARVFVGLSSRSILRGSNGFLCVERSLPFPPPCLPSKLSLVIFAGAAFVFIHFISLEIRVWY